MDAESALALGPCCGCNTDQGVTNLLLLPFRGALPGRGWGCVICDLPSEGACAVLCNACAERYRQDGRYPPMICRGYPAEDGRIPFDLSQLPHQHNTALHREGD